MTTEIDRIAQLDYAMEKGIEQGLQQGLEQGRRNGIVEIARRMLDKGIDEAAISEPTMLPLAEIRALYRAGAS